MRTRGCVDADVEAALDRGDIIRTHVLRPTWHFVHRTDVRWMLRLTRSRVHRVNASWYTKAGLDGATLDRAHRLLAELLADRQPRTRVELADRLAADGIHRSGLALGYLLMHAELEEVICSGPRRGKQHTYTLFDARVPPSTDDNRSAEDAMDELVLRYFRARGPATVADFSRWSNLTATATRHALSRLSSRLASDEVDGTTWYQANPSPPVRRAAGGFLIPMYDELTIGYRQRRVVLASFPPPGVLERPIIVNGLTIGSWKRTLGARSFTLHAHLFQPLQGPQGRRFGQAVAAMERFLDLPATVSTSPRPAR